MPTRETAPIGAPCWVDLMTSDTERSRAFYSELFGWTAEEPAEEFGGYFNFAKDGIRVAGCMSSQPDSPVTDLWSVYLATDDARKTIEMATAAGGQVAVPAMDVGDLGTMAVVVDAGGAAIGMWQPRSFQGFGVLGEPATPAWFELHTRDYQKAVTFYRDVFRWDTHAVGDTPEFSYTTLGARVMPARPGSWTPRDSSPTASRRTGRSTSGPRTPMPRSAGSSTSAARS